MRSAITLCQVPQAAGGPFVFHGELESGFAQAAKLGFDAVELFFPGPDLFSPEAIRNLQERHGLAIAAVGTGAGMVVQGLSLTDPEAGKRNAAREFIRRMIDFGGALGAPAILGSMQGRWSDQVPRETALEFLAEAIREAGEHAGKYVMPFIYEPLNRYETNLFNRLPEAAAWCDQESLDNVVLLADLFHMNIEDADMAEAIRQCGPRVGHVHFADSNRRAVGMGHTDIPPIIGALRSISYTGYLSAEIFPLPTPEEAAAQTIHAFKESMSI